MFFSVEMLVDLSVSVCQDTEVCCQVAFSHIHICTLNYWELEIVKAA